MGLQTWWNEPKNIAAILCLKSRVYERHAYNEILFNDFYQPYELQYLTFEQKLYHNECFDERW